MRLFCHTFWSFSLIYSIFVSAGDRDANSTQATFILRHGREVISTKSSDFPSYPTASASSSRDSAGGESRYLRRGRRRKLCKSLNPFIRIIELVQTAEMKGPGMEQVPGANESAESRAVSSADSSAETRSAVCS
jgi:hypothetical protein